jgi:hypothetical protein
MVSAGGALSAAKRALLFQFAPFVSQDEPAHHNLVLKSSFPARLAGEWMS